MPGVDNPCPTQGSPPKRLRVGTLLRAKAGGNRRHNARWKESSLYIIGPGIGTRRQRLHECRKQWARTR